MQDARPRCKRLTAPAAVRLLERVFRAALILTMLLACRVEGASLIEPLASAQTKARSNPTTGVQAVRVHPEALDGIQTSGIIRLDLAGERSYEGIVERAYETPSHDRVLTGKIRGAEQSEFTLCRRGAEIAGDFEVSPIERYRLRRSRDGVMEIRRIRARTHGHCLNPVTNLQPHERAVRRVKAAPDDPGSFDLLVVYTTAAMTSAGGTAAIETDISLAVESVNAAFANSGISTRARLVHTQEIAYAESGSAQTDLNAITAGSDVVTSGVHAMRDAWHADTVSLFVDQLEPDVAGVANIGIFYNGGQILPEADQAYSVVRTSEASPTALAHEIGHNFGCQHDLQNASVGPEFYPYGYGWRFVDANGVQERTIMAYYPGEAIPYYSSPAVLYAGVPTGVAESADNARVINQNAGLLANFRSARVTSAATSALIGQPFFYLPPGDQGPATFTAVGLPDGLSIDALTGAISGTPSAVGDFAVTVNAVNDFGVFPLSLVVTVTPLPLPAISVSASIAQAYETGKRRGEFTIARAGDLSADLTVSYITKGSAVAGVNYKPLSGRLLLPAGASSAVIRVKPLEDGVATGDRKVKLVLLPGAAYDIGATNSAKVTIIDEG